MRTPREFVQDLRAIFVEKKPFLLSSREQDSVFDTITAHLLKKNLVVVSKVEYDALLKSCQDKKADEIIDKILAEEAVSKLTVKDGVLFSDGVKQTVQQTYQLAKANGFTCGSQLIGAIQAQQ